VTGDRPGLNPKRLLSLLRAAIGRCELDLAGACVLTEAATGAYAVTPVLAALAGAKPVYAFTRPTRHGSLAQVTDETLSLARAAGVEGCVKVLEEITPGVTAQADIVTNSGHLRPLRPQLIEALRPTAVIPLMYEAWEYRAEDLDLAACRANGIAVGGTNERHPAIDVFSFLGNLAAKQLMDSGVAVYGGRIRLLCDNAFAPYLERGLTNAGASVTTSSEFHSSSEQSDLLDAIVVALRPRATPALDEAQLADIATRHPGAVVAQFWGDFDRTAAHRRGVPVWPPEAPAAGHMGILLSAIGPEPIVRLQCGGLKVGEILWRARCAGEDAQQAVAACVDLGWGQALEA
jgi:hypothetical protein